MQEESSAALWQACLDVLAQEVPAQQLATWIRPLQLRPALQGLVLEVANRFKLDWIRAQYLQRLIEVAEQLAGEPVPVELVIAARTPAASRSHAQLSATQPGVISPRKDATEPVVRPIPVPAVADTRSNARLDPRRTFATLVEGSANRMARAAAMHVANAPGQLYNPLFIYGGVGLGKTHLLQAVGHQLIDNHPGARVLYTHAEQFVSDVVKSYQRKAFDEFKARFGGQPREIMVPVANVMAIYARETGQGMAFPPEEDEVPEDGDAPSMEEVEPGMESDEESSAERVVQLVPVKVEAEASSEDDAPRTPPPAGGRPALKRVK